MTPRAEVDRLLGDVQWALSQGLPSRDLVAMLKKLILRADGDSTVLMFAKRQLAELVVEKEPWRAARLAREALQIHDDERAWAVLGLAHTLLGNYRSAAAAYRQALGFAPRCPVYSHNLGHLMDVALGSPRRALHYLRLAYRGMPHEVEVAGSYAHALARAGEIDAARQILRSALGDAHERADDLLEAWLRATPTQGV